MTFVSPLFFDGSRPPRHRKSAALPCLYQQRAATRRKLSLGIASARQTRHLLPRLDLSGVVWGKENPPPLATPRY